MGNNSTITGRRILSIDSAGRELHLHGIPCTLLCEGENQTLRARRFHDMCAIFGKKGLWFVWLELSCYCLVFDCRETRDEAMRTINRL